VYLWQPSGAGPRFNVIPLWWGTLKVTGIALGVGVPLALAAALYVSQVASARWRVWLKPIIELIAGVPTVVMGFLALGILAPVFQRVVGVPFLLNGMVAGVAVGVAIVPVVFSLAEDALSAVPREWVRAALALGATPWEAVYRVVLPAAAPGVSAAVLLGAAQALGETMIVMMVSGNAPTLGWSLWDPVRTVPVTLAIELLSVLLQGLARGIRSRQARLRGEAMA
jgi:phosphate transport system permease protein